MWPASLRPEQRPGGEMDASKGELVEGKGACPCYDCCHIY